MKAVSAEPVKAKACESKDQDAVILDDHVCVNIHMMHVMLINVGRSLCQPPLQAAVATD